MMKYHAHRHGRDVYDYPVPERLGGVYSYRAALINVLQQWYLNRTHPLPAPAKPSRAKK